MAERIPLIYNGSAGQIQEVLATDELNVGFVSATVYSNARQFDTSVSLANSSFNYLHVGPLTVGSGATIFVGAGVSYVVV